MPRPSTCSVVAVVGGIKSTTTNKRGLSASQPASRSSEESGFFPLPAKFLLRRVWASSTAPHAHYPICGLCHLNILIIQTGSQASRKELLLNRIRNREVLHQTTAAALDLIPFPLKALGKAGQASRTDMRNKLLLGQGARQSMNCRRPCGLKLDTADGQILKMNLPNTSCNVWQEASEER